LSCYIMAIDQGTSSSWAIIFDEGAKPIASSQRQVRQTFPKPGWVEQDPRDIWGSVVEVFRDSLSKAGLFPSDISAIGITNQRETTILWDRQTGEPVYNAIVWQSRQSAHICQEIKDSGFEPELRRKTGLLADPYFSGTKIAWILRNVEGAKELMMQGRLMFGTVDTWLSYKLTGGKRHITDQSNASRTLLFDINCLRWDEGLCGMLGISPSVLPDVNESCGNLAITSEDVIGARIPITGLAGDQQSALFGQLCIKQGDVKSTYGTGSFMLMNTGGSPFFSSNGLITTVAWSIAGRTTYALEGSIFVAGSAIQWIRDGLGIVETSAESETLAMGLQSNEGVYFVPAFVGLGTPYWNQEARGTITGITRGTTKAHIARAALESIAYQTMDVLNSMKADCHIEPATLKVDGGMVANGFLMGFLADIAGIEVIRPKFQETTALGAAFLAGIGISHWKGIEDLADCWQQDHTFKPSMPSEEAKRLYFGWKRCIRASLAACSE